MEIYSTEEQQVEAIKSWWQKNGNFVIVGVIVGLGTVFGWRQYQDWQVSSREKASDAYQDTVTAVSEKSETSADAVAAFTAEHKNSAYNPLLQLQLAKSAIEAGDATKAAVLLSDVLATLEADSPLRSVTRVRLAKAHVAAGDNDSALSVLADAFPKAFSAQTDELKGDIYLLMDNKIEAKVAFEAAIAAADGKVTSPLLQRKLDDLAGLASE